jgi:VCBS repeat-containing protein
MFKRFVVSGTKKDNILSGTDRLDIMFGRNGDDVLDGRGGWDFLFGGKGNDKLFGGDGNDWLFGGKGKDELFGGDGKDKLFGGKGDDFLDGGAGSDYVFGDKGNDTFNFTLSENGGAKDYYDGGKGFDTLQLSLTSAEYDAAKAEIDEFEALLADGVKDFRFDSLGLKVRNFEDVSVELVGAGNAAPVAAADEFPAREDGPIGGNVLANDTDAEDGIPPRVSAVNDQAGNVDAMITLPSGALLTVNQDGTFTYDPNGQFENLGVGDFAEDSFTYVAQDSQGADSDSAAEVKIVIAGVNDAPVALDDEVTALAELTMPDLIRVAVLGVDGSSTHDAAVMQLNSAIFSAEAIDYTDVISGGWGARLAGFDVVVLGAAESNDYGATTDLFAALNTHVSTGHGVVTTGWFAQALSTMDPSIRGQADIITPITPEGRSYSSNTFGTTPNDTITVSPEEIPNEITGSIDMFQSGGKFGWELAFGIDSGAIQLAEGVAGDRDVPGDFGTPYAAIASADNVGQTEVLPGGKTVYLGGMYVASATYVTGATRGEVQDAIFEQAIAWAAGGMGTPTASAKIHPADLLAKDTDVDASDVLAIVQNDFPMLSTNGAALSFDEFGDIIYTPTADGLQQLLAGQDISDSFGYRVTDDNGGFSDLATVNLTVDSPLL